MDTAKDTIDRAVGLLVRRGAGWQTFKAMTVVNALFSVGLAWLIGHEDIGRMLLVAFFTFVFFELFFGVCVGLLVWSMFDRPMVKEFRQAIAEPSRIRWIYRMNRVGSRSGTHPWLCLGMADKKTVHLQLTFLPPQMADDLLVAVASLAPHAAIGFTPELQQAFERDPASVCA